MLTDDGKDTINLNGATLQKIDAGNDDDIINLNSGRLLGSVFGDKGHDTIELKEAIIDFDIHADEGNDTILLYSGSARNVNGGDGDDTITLNGANVTRIGGGSGNNTIQLLGGSVNGIITRADMDGKNLVVLDGATVYSSIRIQGGNDTIRLLSGTLGGDVYTGGGNDVISLDGVEFSGTIFSGVGDDHTDLLSGQVGEVQGGAGSDTIKMSHSEDPQASLIVDIIHGGGVDSGQTDGDDTIELNAGTVGWVYGAGGNDTITLNGTTVSEDIYGDWSDSLPNYWNPRPPYETGDDTFWLVSGQLRGSLFGEDGSDKAHIFSSYDLSPFQGMLDGGDDASVADGYIDELTIQASSRLAGDQIVNWEKIVVSGADLTLTGDTFATAHTDEYGMFLQNARLHLDDGLQFTGNLSIDAASALHVSTEGGDGDFEFVGDLTSLGRINLQGSNEHGKAGDMLSIEGDFIGGGYLLLDVVLDDGTSQLTDRLLVDGDTSGTTLVFVDNDGGTGGFTGEGSPHGIQIIEVAGASDGQFELGAPVEVGAFRYDLHQADDQNWYLQSNGPSCTVVIVSQVPHSLRHMGSQLISSWDERSGGLIEPGAESSAPATDFDYSAATNSQYRGSQTGLWSRTIGASNSAKTNLRGTGSNDSASHEESLWAMQTGFDALTKQTLSGDIYVGAFAHYGLSSADGVNETMGGSSVGSYDLEGFGTGVSLTFLSKTGLYLDGVVTHTKYDLDLKTALGDIGSGFANVWTLSGEAGRQISFANGFSVIPQMQLVYQNLDIGGMTIGNDTHATSLSDESLIGLIGVKAEFSPNAGLRFYGEAKLGYEFLQYPETWVDWETFSADYGSSRYQVDMGFQWHKRADSALWAEVGYSDSFAHSHNRFWTFTAGLKLLH
ncbi:MAG: autotransporter outer membrane beta-barrel domain-containing protein [Rhizobiaceae bacterium]